MFKPMSSAEAANCDLTSKCDSTPECDSPQITPLAICRFNRLCRELEQLKSSMVRDATHEAAPLLMHELSRGSHGCVYKGVYEYLDGGRNTYTDAAIKVISDRYMVEGRNELWIFSRLVKYPHINICEFLCAQYVHSVLYLTLEFIDGVDTLTYLESLPKHKLTGNDLIEFNIQLITGISHLHCNGIAHCDLKPENVMITANPFTIKIIDFGLSEMGLHGSPVLVTNKLRGTTEYLAPELIAIAYRIKNRSVKIYTYVATITDMWAAGILIYIAAHGVVPFTRRAFAKHTARGNYPPLIADNCECELSQTLCRTLLVKDPAKRATAVDVATVVNMYV